MINLYDFKNYLIVKGLAEQSIENYLCRTKVFASFVQDKHIDNQIIQDFIVSLKNKQAQTINGYLASLRHLIEYLKLDIKLPQSRKKEKRLPKYIDEKYFLNEIIPTVECIFKNTLQKKAILYFMFYTGIRVGEFKGLMRKNIDLENKIAKIYGYKTSTERIVFYPQKVADILKMYFDNEQEKENAFNTNVTSVQNIFRKLNEWIKGEKLHPHLFRHSALTMMRKKGMNIEDIKEIAGHSDISSTMIYAHPDMEEIGKKYKKLIK